MIMYSYDLNYFKPLVHLRLHSVLIVSRLPAYLHWSPDPGQERGKFPAAAHEQEAGFASDCTTVSAETTKWMTQFE